MFSLNFIRKWMIGYNYRVEKSFFKKRGEWDKSPEVLVWLAGIIERFNFSEYSVSKGKHAFIDCKLSNIKDFHSNLLKIIWSLENGDPITLLTIPLQRISIDEFLTDSKGYSIDISTSIKVLSKDVLRLVFIYQLIYSEEDPKFDYYERNLTGIFKEIRDILEAFTLLTNELSSPSKKTK